MYLLFLIAGHARSIGRYPQLIARFGLQQNLCLQFHAEISLQCLTFSLQLMPLITPQIKINRAFYPKSILTSTLICPSGIVKIVVGGMQFSLKTDPPHYNFHIGSFALKANQSALARFFEGVLTQNVRRYDALPCGHAACAS